jgi:hypothetical protein
MLLFKRIFFLLSGFNEGDGDGEGNGGGEGDGDEDAKMGRWRELG